MLIFPQYSDMTEEMSFRYSSIVAIAWAGTTWLVTHWPARWSHLGPLRTFIAIEDLQEHITIVQRPPQPRWKTFAVRAGAYVFAAYWAFALGYHSQAEAWPLRRDLLPYILLAAAWTISLVSDIAHHPPYSIIGLCILHIVSVLVHITGPFPQQSPLSNSLIVELTLTALALLIAALGFSYSLSKYSVGDDVATTSDYLSPDVARGRSDTFRESLSRGREAWLIHPQGWLTFTWVAPLIKVGGRKTIEDADVWRLSPFMRSRILFRNFRQYRARSLFWRIFGANSLDFTITITFAILIAILSYVPPYLINQLLIARRTTDPEARWSALTFALLAFASKLVEALLSLQLLSAGRRADVRIRSELIALIHDKALRRRDMTGVLRRQEQMGGTADLDTKEVDTASAGKVVNLMSSDANRCAEMAVSLFFLFQTPVEIAIALFLLYRLLGPSAFAGLAGMAVVVPLQQLLTKRDIRLTEALKDMQDKRINAVTELMQAIRFIKSYGWEHRFAARVLDTRETELGWLIKERINTMLISLLWTIAPSLVIMLSFATYTLVAGQALDIPTAFTSIALFEMLSGPLTGLPMQIGWFLQFLVSVRRIDSFLSEPEVADWACALKRDNSVGKEEQDEAVIGFRKASFQWHSSSKVDDVLSPVGETPKTTSIDLQDTFGVQQTDRPFQLRDLDVVFPFGQLTLIAGSVGSGKSSILSALLGEMTCISGEVHLDKRHGKVAYASQVPWLEHASIRQNILFSEKYDAPRYNEVVRVCCLEDDLRQLADGDATEVGERGISLSGGQKARVALARAVYSRAEVLLLDDPLSAVDAMTGNRIFHECLRGPLCRGRTVLLVTHHVALCLPAAAMIVTLADGCLASVVNAEKIETIEAARELLAELDEDEKGPGETPSPTEPLESTENDERQEARKFIEDEEISEGSVPVKVYKTYLVACGWWLWIVILGLLSVEKSAIFMQKLVLKAWSEANQAVELVGSSTFVSFGDASHLGATTLGRLTFPSFVAQELGDTLPDAKLWLLRYFGTYMLHAIAALSSLAILYIAALKGSRKLFKQCLHRLIRAPSRFFDVTPQGRILNRMSADVDTVDTSVASTFNWALDQIFAFISTLIIIGIILPQLLVVALFILGLYYWYSRAFIATTRDLRRLEANARSPLFSAFGEMLVGLPIIRAFAAEERFQEHCFDQTDHFARFDWAYWMANRFLLYRFDLLGAIFILLVTAGAIYSDASQGFVAIILVSAAGFQENVYWLCRMVAYLQQQLNAVERIQTFIEIDSEAADVVDAHLAPPAYWPSDSAGLDIEHLSVRYAPHLPLVLDDVSLSFRPSEKVAIIGRTGSGKSTLAQALLRFLEADSGRILLDGVDIGKIGLGDLRSRGITVIAQEATLWSGDLRGNVDPFGDHDDATIWDVLQRVQLVGSHAVSATSSGRSTPPHDSQATLVSPDETETTSPVVPRQAITSLDFALGDNGGNLSAGQRSLVSLARALLRRPKCIVLDEATASVDFETDAAIQRTIREDLQDSLVVTIAHRLRTVIDCDRVVVLAQGKVVETGSPRELLDRRGAFYELVKESADGEELMAAVR